MHPAWSPGGAGGALADHLPLSREAAAAAAGRADRAPRSRAVWVPCRAPPLTGCVTLDWCLRPSACLRLLTSDRGARRAPGRRPPRRRVGAVRGEAPHPVPARGEASGPGPLTPAPPPSRRSPVRPPARPPAPQTPPYMTPRAPRRSLSRSISGPGSRAPPAASSSAGHRVRHLPGSPGITPGRQSQPSAGPRRRGSRHPGRRCERGGAGRGGASHRLRPRFREVRARRGGGAAEPSPQLSRTVRRAAPGSLRSARTQDLGQPPLPPQNKGSPPTLRSHTVTLGVKTSQFL